MHSEIARGIIGIIFLVLCIGFASFAAPSPREASAHPFLDPQVASVGSAVYLADDGTLTTVPPDPRGAY